MSLKYVVILFQYTTNINAEIIYPEVSLDSFLSIEQVNSYIYKEISYV